MALSNTSFRLTATSRVATAFGGYNVALSQITSGFDPGTAANQADILYVGTRSTSTSGDSIDLTGGSLSQPDGSAFNAVDVVAIAIVNRSTTASLTVGGGTNAIAGVSLTVGPNGMAATTCPNRPAFAVTAGTGDILKVTASAGTVAYDIFILARSA